MVWYILSNGFTAVFCFVQLWWHRPSIFSYKHRPGQLRSLCPTADASLCIHALAGQWANQHGCQCGTHLSHTNATKTCHDGSAVREKPHEEAWFYHQHILNVIICSLISVSNFACMALRSSYENWPLVSCQNSVLVQVYMQQRKLGNWSQVTDQHFKQQQDG